MWYKNLSLWIEKHGGMRELYRKGDNGKPRLYMRRFYLIKSKYFELMLHQFFMSDAIDVHDHPWASFGCILETGYTEHLGNNEKTVRRIAGDFSCRGAKAFHRVELITGTEGKVWTLFGTLKRTRNWGFLVDENWVPSDEYFKSNGTFEVQSRSDEYSGIVFPKKMVA
jgi:hypothetical protein